MKRVLLVSALMVMSLSVPGFAGWVNWTDNFESYTTGDLSGQGGWFTPDGTYADTSAQVVSGQNHTTGGSKSAAQYYSTSLYSSSVKDMRYLNQGSPYGSGFMKVWVWEPGVSKGEDFRVGVYGSGNRDYGGHGENNAGSMFTANLQNAVPSWWRAQWTSDPRALDGTVSASSTGYKWTPYASAPRKTVAGWSYVILSWGFDFALGTGYAEWRINRATPNIRLDFDSTAVPASSGGRWQNSTPIYGITIGSQVVKLQNTAGYAFADDFEFHGNTPYIEPEPSSLLALGMGLAGLIGLMKRKR